MNSVPKGKTQNPLNNKKNNVYETPSSSSLTIPVPKQKGPSAASETNTNPSISEAAWALVKGAGKLAFNVGTAAAIGVARGGLEIVNNQFEHYEKLKETERNEKLKQTFYCYCINRKKIIYQGTLYFSEYHQIVFSSNHELPTHATSFFENEAPNPKVEIKIPFGEVFEINQVNAENPSNRARIIKIRALKRSYGFWGFDDYDKAYNTIYSLVYRTTS